MIEHLAIFGATGDLTGRYLLPALVRLHAARALPSPFHVRALGREEGNTAQYRAAMDRRLKAVEDLPGAAREAIVRSLEYRRADVTSAPSLREALGDVRRPIVAYLALPPFVVAPAAEALGELGLPEGSRVVFEKPFGEDRASARQLNDLAHRVFSEDAIFRIDHFLALQTVQNILGLRFANRIFEPVWNCLHVRKVEIAWEETLTIEGRASYDQVGALRDMVQNHLLQVLCLIAMEPPPTLGARDLRDRKFDLLRATRRLGREEIVAHTRRARYLDGRIGSRKVPAYAAEPGVDPGRMTETLAEVTLFIDNWRWAGIPFVLRSGKGLGADRKEVKVHFGRVPHLAFGESVEPEPNVLCIELDPERLSLGVNLNDADSRFTLASRRLVADLAPEIYGAYGRLLLDILEGDPTLSIRDDEAEESWRIIEPIMEAWRAGAVPLEEYPAGSAGPLGSG